ncbi:MAG: HAD-IIB family hydrolase [Paracoccaceae bacterium]
MIVFTDLDGTLLDHDTYRHDAAAPALARLKGAGVPVVLASSKTAAEVVPLRAELDLSDVPAIVENGAGVVGPDESVEQSNDGYARLREAIDALPAPLRRGFQGFGDWGPEEIAARTGLPIEEARLAADRRFSEPGLWVGEKDDLRPFLDALAVRGLHARDGGRYLTISFGGTKAAQMEAILDRYGAPFAVALGDAPNDVEMLERADLGIIVANPHRPPLPELPGEAKGHIRRAAGAGPEGWNTAILTLLAERGL